MCNSCSFVDFLYYIFTLWAFVHTILIRKVTFCSIIHSKVHTIHLETKGSSLSETINSNGGEKTLTSSDNSYFHRSCNEYSQVKKGYEETKTANSKAVTSFIPDAKGPIDFTSVHVWRLSEYYCRKDLEADYKSLCSFEIEKMQRMGTVSFVTWTVILGLGFVLW